jgi:hypothetical protein
MKVISMLLGRFAVVVNLDEVLPEGGLDPLQAIMDIKEEYGFAVSPQGPEVLQKMPYDGLKFGHGRFRLGKDQERRIREFTIWNDGLLADAYDTSDAEAFLDDFLKWGAESLHLRASLERLQLRHFTSELVVEFDYSPSEKLVQLQSVTGAFDESLQVTYGVGLPGSSITAIHFDYDHAEAPSGFNRLVPFTVSRRRNHRHAKDNAFFSQAPLTSQRHIELLESLESALSE